MQASAFGAQGLGAGQGDLHTPRDALGLRALPWPVVRGAALAEQVPPRGAPHLPLAGACGGHGPNGEAAGLTSPRAQHVCGGALAAGSSPGLSFPCLSGARLAKRRAQRVGWAEARFEAQRAAAVCFSEQV